MPEEHELLVLAKKMRLDMDALRAKQSELIRALAALDLPTEKFECLVCKARFKGNLALSEHVYLSHDGAEPEHWLKAEELADEPAEV